MVLAYHIYGRDGLLRDDAAGEIGGEGLEVHILQTQVPTAGTWGTRQNPRVVRNYLNSLGVSSAMSTARQRIEFQFDPLHSGSFLRA